MASWIMWILSFFFWDFFQDFDSVFGYSWQEKIINKEIVYVDYSTLYNVNDSFLLSNSTYIEQEGNYDIFYQFLENSQDNSLLANILEDNFEISYSNIDEEKIFDTHEPRLYDLWDEE